MKKKLVLLLAAALLISSAGCGTQKTSTPSESGSGASEAVSESGSVSSETESASTSKKKLPNKAETALKDVFAKHNMKVGTCIAPQMTNTDKYSKHILQHFNSITMENSMKPDASLNRELSIAAGEPVVKFNNDVIQMLKFAKDNGMGVRGHTIIWHSQTPNWIFFEDFDESKKMVGRDEMLKRMEAYIKNVFQALEETGYADIVYAYDVANECWMEDGSMRQSNWKATIGDDYLWYAFSYARKYAPEHIELYYNDYNEQFKPDALVKFVNTLVDADGKSLIDGVGFQAHLYTKDDLNLYFEGMDKVAKTGLKIQLTELDVCLGEYEKPQIAADKNTRQQGIFYYELINGIFERVDAGTVKMDALTFWGFSDEYSWRGEYSPLFLNKIFLPKYAYFGIIQDKENAGYE